MNELTDVVALDLFPFTCLPRAAQRVISISQPEAARSSVGAGDVQARGTGRTDVAHRLHIITRAVAAQLLWSYGVADTTVPIGADRAPQWPHGFIGSITHTARFAAVAVMPRSMARSVGIDAECELVFGQEQLVREYCLVDQEFDTLCGGDSSLSATQISALCFSAKEAVFKCLYPLVNHYFDFKCVRIMKIDEGANTLSIAVLDVAIARCVGTTELTGSYRFVEGHVFTAVRLTA